MNGAPHLGVPCSAIGGRDNTRTAVYSIAREIESLYGDTPTYERMHQLLTPLGIDDISFADILTAAMAEYERQLHQRIELEKHQDIKRTLERLGYEKKQTSSSHTRQPFLSRPIRALRQWWHDLKQSTVPVERLETVGMNSTSMGCDGCHTQVK